MSGPFLVEVAPDATEVALAHACRDGQPRPIVVRMGDTARARLADGETFPATGKCPVCGGRVFASLIDPAARTARRLAAVPDPTALRPPAPTRERSHLRLVRPEERIKAEPCGACGVVPDQFGLCRCSK